MLIAPIPINQIMIQNNTHCTVSDNDEGEEKSEFEDEEEEEDEGAPAPKKRMIFRTKQAPTSIEFVHKHPPNRLSRTQFNHD